LECCAYTSAMAQSRAARCRENDLRVVAGTHCGKRVTCGEWGSVILPATVWSLLGSAVALTIYARPGRWTIDDSMRLILAGGTAAVVAGFYFLPKDHGEDGVTTMLVVVPFGTLGAFSLHFASALLELCMDVLPARLLLSALAAYLTWEAWTTLLRRERGTFTVCLLCYVALLLLWWCAYGMVQDGTYHFPWDAYSAVRAKALMSM